MDEQWDEVSDVRYSPNPYMPYIGRTPREVSMSIAGRWGGILVTAIIGIKPNKPTSKRRNEMKPTVDNILAQYNIRPYNGSWYVQEKKLREVLEQIIEQVYEAGVKSTGEKRK